MLKSYSFVCSCKFHPLVRKSTLPFPAFGNSNSVSPPHRRANTSLSKPCPNSTFPEHSIYSKDFNAKNRDVIEHYLEEQGQFVTPKNMSKTQYVSLSISLSFLQKKPLQLFYALRANNKCMGSEPVTITKTMSLIVFVFTSTTPITKVHHGPEIPVSSNEFISAVLLCSIFHID